MARGKGKDGFVALGIAPVAATGIAGRDGAGMAGVGARRLAGPGAAPSAGATGFANRANAAARSSLKAASAFATGFLLLGS
jgi:hypothetical protein